MITEAQARTGTLVSSGTKVTGTSTKFGPYPNLTNGHELLTVGDYIFVVKAGVGEVRKVEIIDEKQQILYVDAAFSSNLDGQAYYRIPRNYDEGIRFPLFSVTNTDYSVALPLPGRISVNVEAELGALNQNDGSLKIQTMNQPLSTPTDVEDSSKTLASTDTGATVNLDAFTVGKWIKIVFTRGTNTAGGVQFNVYINRNNE